MKRCMRINLALSSVRLFSASRSVAAELHKRIVFQNAVGQNIELDACYEDTQPNGSPVGTVIALHGVPGSHKDFKYVKPLMEQKNIRLININYPGFGYTPFHDGIRFDNVERNNFFNTLIDEINVGHKVVMMGHSRGTENALMLALQKKAVGLVMVNPTGLRRHRGISPGWFFKGYGKLYENKILRPILEPLAKIGYDKVGMRVSDGAIASHAIQSLNTMALGDQAQYIRPLKDSSIKTLFFYAGKDWIVEKEIMEEFVKVLGLHQMYCDKKTDERDLINEMTDLLNTKNVSIFFEDDGHYLQKFRAAVISDGIEHIFRNS